MTERPMWAGTCQADGLIVQSSEVNMVFAILAVHCKKCNKKHWAETYSQYLARLKNERLMVEVKAKKQGPFPKGSEV